MLCVEEEEEGEFSSFLTKIDRADESSPINWQGSHYLGNFRVRFDTLHRILEFSKTVYEIYE